jgi:hypothetical protein
VGRATTTIAGRVAVEVNSPPPFPLEFSLVLPAWLAPVFDSATNTIVLGSATYSQANGSTPPAISSQGIFLASLNGTRNVRLRLVDSVPSGPTGFVSFTLSFPSA